MLIGRMLLKDKKIMLADLNHRNFKEVNKQFEKRKNRYHADAVNDLTLALKTCYGDREISLQQLSATFRRGHLLEMLGAERQ